MPAARTALVALAMVFAEAPALANSAVAIDNDSVVVSDEVEGRLMLFKRGAHPPQWVVGMQRGNWPHSRVATTSRLPDGTILVAERHGPIRILSSDGTVLDERTPMYEFVKLSVPMEERDNNKLRDQVEYVGTTSAAFVSADKKSIFLIADHRSIPRKVAINTLLGYRDALVPLTDALVFMFKDENLVSWERMDVEKVPLEGEWVRGSYAATALAACEDQLIVGTNEGVVYFISEHGDSSDFRVRQISKAKGDVSVLDAGCLANSLAFTVSYDAGNQVQLWDLKTKTALSFVAAGKLGHPGIALAGVPGASGQTLMTLGDFDVRLWSVEARTLKLLSRYYPGTKEPIQSGAALPSGDFVFWDGRSLWSVPHSGAAAEYYAGQAVDRMESCGERELVRCWSAKKAEK